MTTYTPDVQKGYLDLWSSAKVRPERVREVDVTVDRIMAASAWSQYQEVEKTTGVPAFVVGIIHVREASQNFKCHLHNGDPLTARTVHVPAGRLPPPAQPPFKWDDSADDALTMTGQHLDAWHDWTVAGIAFVLERYNGFGYRSHGVNSPYLWGFTTAYTAGMYTADSVWSTSAVNGNPGGMAMLRRAVDRKLLVVSAMPTAVAPAVVVSQSPQPAVPAVTKPDLRVVMDHVRTVMADWSALGLYQGGLDGDPGPMFKSAADAFHKLVN